MSTLNISLYVLSHILLILLEAINTKYSLQRIDRYNYSFLEMCGFHYMLIFGKLILIMDVYYFSSFYFKKTLNNVIQIKVIKILSMIIWIYLGIRLRFSPGIIVYLCLKFFSYILLWMFQKEESPVAYHIYNFKVSLDLQIIRAHLISEIIEALKSTAVICAALLIFFDTIIISTNLYILLFPTKVIALLVDRILYKRMTNRMKYYEISTITMSLLSIIGIGSLIPLVIINGFKKEPIFIFNEVLMISIAILLIYYLYLKMKEHTTINRSNDI